jgi:glycogen synthase
MKRARELFHDKATWTALMERAMARDFSWTEAAQRYETIYEQVTLKAVA